MLLRTYRPLPFRCHFHEAHNFLMRLAGDPISSLTRIVTVICTRSSNTLDWRVRSIINVCRTPRVWRMQNVLRRVCTTRMVLRVIRYQTIIGQNQLYMEALKIFGRNTLSSFQYNIYLQIVLQPLIFSE